MRRFCRCMIILGVAVFLLGMTGVCSAGEVVQGEKIIGMKGEPVATAVATGGKMVFVLMRGGTVAIYSDTGDLKGSLKVSESATHIATNYRGDKLYVTDSVTKSIKILDLDFIAEFDTQGSPSKGPEKAPITIVEFSDFECPYCSRLAPVIHKVLEKYPDKVRLVFKNYPLTRTHKMAMKAAIASLAAQKQGRFWDYHDKLFENHNRLSDQKFLDIAKEMGLDMGKFELDRGDPEIAGLINRDIKEAKEYNLRGVPTLFINGHKLVGGNMLSLTGAIERELKKISDKKN